MSATIDPSAERLAAATAKLRALEAAVAGAVLGQPSVVREVVVALAAEWVVGDLVTHGRDLDTLGGTLLVGAAAGFAALVTGVVVLGVGDRGMMQEVTP